MQFSYVWKNPTTNQKTWIGRFKYVFIKVFILFIGIQINQMQINWNIRRDRKKNHASENVYSNIYLLNILSNVEVRAVWSTAMSREWLPA